MAATSESEVEEDVFLGFDAEERETVAAWRQQRFEARNQSNSKSDISVSSVSTEDLSDFEEEEDEEETWNENPNPGHDKLFKVHPVLDHVVQGCKMEPRPQKDLSVDEVMVKFKGQLGMKQYMPMKPVKCGIKLWVCVEASSSFLCDFQDYTGKRQGDVAKQNLGNHVVHDLTRSFNGKNHHVFHDNVSSTVKLAEDLLEDQIYSCAMARVNRKDFPKDLAANNPRVNRLKQGEALFR